jgi:hypothetical protein
MTGHIYFLDKRENMYMKKPRFIKQKELDRDDTVIYYRSTERDNMPDREGTIGYFGNIFVDMHFVESCTTVRVFHGKPRVI